MAKSGVILQWNKLDKALLKMAKEVNQTTELMENIGVMLHRNTQKRFEKEEDPTGKKWKKSKRALLEGGQTLNNSGNLKKNISYIVKKNTVHVGTNVVYARIHQFGGIIKPKSKKRLTFKTSNNTFSSTKEVTIPDRPFIGISKDDQDEAWHLIVEHLKNSFTG